jgi:hypothetical protein
MILCGKVGSKLQFSYNKNVNSGEQRQRKAAGNNNRGCAVSIHGVHEALHQPQYVILISAANDMPGSLLLQRSQQLPGKIAIFLTARARAIPGEGILFYSFSLP